MSKEQGSESAVSRRQSIKEEEMAEEKEAPKRVSRREFVKGAAVGGAGVAAAGALASCAPAAAPAPTAPPEAPATAVPVPESPPSTPPWMPEEWDKEADVVVVGAGAGGLVAALQAVKEENVKVILLEKWTMIGGNQRWAGGADWPEFTYEEYRRFAPAGDPEWQRILLENGRADNDWLAAMGAKFAPEFLEPPEHTKYFPDPTWEVNGQTWPKSAALVEWEANMIKEAGGEILVETPMVKLVADPEGLVLGVRAVGPEGPLTIKAKRGVILATGGYAANPGLRAQYVGKYAQNFRLRFIHTCTGDGILAALEVGGMVNDGIGLWHGNLLPAPPAKIDPNTMSWPELDACSMGWAIGIVVNVDGLRFADESSGYFDHKVTEQTDARLFIIFDQKIREDNAGDFDNVVNVAGAAVASAETIEELAKMLQEWGGPEFPREVNPDNVITTFNEYNKAVDEGKTLELRPPRRGDIMKLDTPPFYAVETWPGMTDNASGLVTDIKARVLDRNMTPIPHLYAVGCDGMRVYEFDHNGVSGALIQGRIAAKNAAAETPWE